MYGADDRRTVWIVRVIVGVVCVIFIAPFAFLGLGAAAAGQTLALGLAAKIDGNAALEMSAAREARTEERIHAAFIDSVRDGGVGSAITLPAVEAQVAPCASNQGCSMTAADMIAPVGSPEEVQPGLDIRNAAAAQGVLAREIDYRIELTTVTQVPYFRKNQPRVRELLVRTFSVMPYSTIEDVTGIEPPPDAAAAS